MRLRPRSTRSCAGSRTSPEIRAGGSHAAEHRARERGVHPADRQPAGGAAESGALRAIASRLMRQILVQYARNRGAGKRDGGCRIALEDIAELLYRTTPNWLRWTMPDRVDPDR